MFWGLIMEPQKRYSQVVKKSFHVSMASLDLGSCTDDAVQVMCGFENRKYLLCTLKKDQILQCSLDLNFEVGDEVSFVTNGTSHVHLTGYLNDDFNDQEFEDEDDVEEEEDEVVDQLGNISASNITSGKRPKKASSAHLQLNGLASLLDQKLDAMSYGPPAKKSKTMQLLEEVVADEDSDDSDVNLSNLADSDNEDDSSQEEEQSDDEDAEEVNEEEDEDDESSDDGEEEESDDEDVTSSTWAQAQVNGVKKTKEDKKNKQEMKPEPVTPTPKKAKKEPKTEEKVSPKKESSQKRTVEGGVVIEDIKHGEGQVAKQGKMVQVYYEGRFKNNNKMFDSSLKGSGFKFRLGRQEVIKGWDVGVTGMKVGGKRRIVCPPNMAYGAKGSPPAIPPNSTLVFEVELKKVN